MKKSEGYEFYPIKQITKIFPGPVTCAAHPTDNLQTNYPKAVNICFVSQIASHCIFWSHVASAEFRSWKQHHSSSSSGSSSSSNEIFQFTIPIVDQDSNNSEEFIKHINNPGKQ